MFTQMAKPFVLAVTIVMFWALACNSFSTTKSKDLALSKALAQVKIFEELTDGERDALKVASTLRRGRAKERIIEQGTTLDRMFIILEGQAEVWVNGKHIVTLDGQTLVGEVEFLDMLPASADVVLLKDTDLVELNHASLTGLMEKNSRLGYRIMREIAKIEARRLRDSNPK
jgi:CRP/FNR family cyclic AMP-dependent transcriptional regulator